MPEADVVVSPKNAQETSAVLKIANYYKIPVTTWGGGGIKGSEEIFFKAAEKLGAQIGASRALVDMGEAQYEHQIGLTGKTVCPNVYIAVGISGAVQHICGMEQSNVIIAINPDKTAPIFDYADYGIVGEANEVLSEIIK